MTKAKQLKNGMRFLTLPYKGTSAVTVLVLVDVGSRHESTKVEGGSHVIEHMMFKGTTRRPTNLDIARELDRYGAEFNAYTGKDITGYYVRIDADQTSVAIDLLHDMLFHSKFDATELNREKKVIVEEIKMYEENPIMHIEDMIESVLFEGTKLGADIAGTPESVVNMKRADVLAYRDEHYTPEKMVVVMAGAVPANAQALLEKTFGSLKATEHEVRAYETIANITDGAAVRAKVEYKPLKQVQLAMGFPTVAREHADVPAIKLISMILGGSMSSRLFVEVRERKGLCYAIGTQIEFYEDIGGFVIRAGLDTGRLPKAAQTILKELKKVKREGVTKKELQYAKDHLEGAMKLSLENSSARAAFYGKQELYSGQMKTPQERMAELRAVTLSDIKRVANEVFDIHHLCVAAIGPYKKEEELMKHFKTL